jgi:elongation factor 1-alpha
MDVVDYKEEKFNEIKEQITKLIRVVGFKPDNTEIIPISAFNGTNITSKPEAEMPWYKGKTLLETVDSFVEPKKPTDKPLRLPVQDVFTITGVGTVPVGKVETGIMKVGDKVIFEPASTILGKPVTGEVKTIEMHHVQMQQAEPGDNVGFSVRGVGKKDIRRGDVLGHAKGHVQGTDCSAYPPDRSYSRIHPGVPLIHLTGRLHLRGAHRQARQEDWRCRRGEPQVPQVR